MRGRLYLPNLHCELHHRICHLRYGTHGYGMSVYIGFGRRFHLPKVSAAASLMEMALALVSRLWLLSFMISKSSSIGAFSIFSGVRYFSRMPMDVLTQREENCFSYSGKICSIIVPIRSLISVLEEMTESR